MTCLEFKASIESYLDRDLSGPDSAEFEAHLLSCETCRLELQSFDKCSSILRKSLEDKDPPETIADNVRRKLDTES